MKEIKWQAGDQSCVKKKNYQASTESADFQKKKRACITRRFTAQLAQLTVRGISPRLSIPLSFLILVYVQPAMPDGPRDATLGPMVPPSYSDSMSSGTMSLRMEGTAISSAVQARRRYWKQKKITTQLRRKGHCRTSLSLISLS